MAAMKGLEKPFEDVQNIVAPDLSGWLRHGVPDISNSSGDDRLLGLFICLMVLLGLPAPETPRRMVQITEVARSTYLLDLGEIPVLAIPEVAYLLVDDISVLIEPGSTTTASKLLTSSNELGLNLGNIGYIIPTHIHVDHGGGAGYLAQNLPKAKVVLHPKAAAHMIEPSRLIQSTRLIFGEGFEEAFGSILPVPESQIHVASEGEVIQLGKRELRIVFSPGHASHHISIQDSLTEGLFCGEALGLLSANMPDIPLPAAAPPFDLELYLETMEKLRKLSPKLLFYSHNGVRSDAENLIKRAKENSLAFGNIIQSEIEAGGDQQRMLERLSEYVKGRFTKIELPSVFQLSIFGYIDYFTNKKSPPNLREPTRGFPTRSLEHLI